MKRNTIQRNRAYIQNNINKDVIEIELSQKDLQTILRYKRVLCNNISETRIFNDSSLIRIKVVYGKKNSIQIFGGQMFIFENNIIEYFVDKDLLIQNYIFDKGYKYNYDKLKEVVYLDSAGK